MKRLVLDNLKAWKIKPDRKPLILRGVRQCGKTHILQEFSSSFSSSFYMNFEENPRFKDLFADDLSPEKIIQGIEFSFNKKLILGKDIFIFDEIQECPRAITSLKYFHEKIPELAICCAGSHIGIKGNSFSFPVGKVEFINMYPMNFAEFLMNYSYENFKIIPKMIEEGFNPLVDNELFQIFKYYLVTGGLPEVVKSFLNNKENLREAFQKCREIQKQLLEGYQADFAKHCGKINASHIHLIFQNIPQQLQKIRDGASKRYHFKSIIPNRSKYSQLSGPIEWLVQSALALKITQVSKVETPLKAYASENEFRLFLFDIGMLNSMLDIQPFEILEQKVFSYTGFLAENFIAQELQFLEIPTYSLNEIRSEIEFLINYSGEIIPIEVKAGKNLKSKSLASYKKRYNPRVTIKFSGKPLQFEKDQISAPLYLSSFMKLLIERYSNI